MLRAMFSEVFNFVWLYMVCVLGFGLTLWGLSSSSSNPPGSFDTAGYTFLQFFTALLGNIS